MYMWSRFYPSRLISEELDINRDIIVDWRNFIRDICLDWKRIRAPKLGGINEDLSEQIVEIDKSAFGKLGLGYGFVIN
jgi:hypothetical protein